MRDYDRYRNKAEIERKVANKLSQYGAMPDFDAHDVMSQNEPRQENQDAIAARIEVLRKHREATTPAVQPEPWTPPCVRREFCYGRSEDE